MLQSLKIEEDLADLTKHGRHGELYTMSEYVRRQKHLILPLNKLYAVKRAAQPHIASIEEALLSGNSLNGFTFNPYKGDANPAFTEEEEEYARAGVFSLV